VRSFVLALAVSLVSVGCVDTSPNRVKLTASVDSVSLVVKPSSLVTDLSGSFQLGLVVGDLASSNDVIQEAPTFQVVSADGAGIGIDALTSGTTFPLTLSSGENTTLTFTLTDQNSLTSDEHTRLCAGPVKVVASFRDSLGGNTATSVSSSAISVGGCSP
jgi:hypothetical protein